MKREINETNSWFIEKINQINKSLARLTGERTQINKIRNKRGDVTSEITEWQSIIETAMNKYANKLDNVKEMNKFLETNTFPSPNHEESNFQTDQLPAKRLNQRSKFPNKENSGTSWLWWQILSNIQGTINTFSSSNSSKKK